MAISSGIPSIEQFLLDMTQYTDYLHQYKESLVYSNPGRSISRLAIPLENKNDYWQFSLHLNWVYFFVNIIWWYGNLLKKIQKVIAPTNQSPNRSSAIQITFITFLLIATP